MDDGRAVRVEEGGNLLLDAASDLGDCRNVNPSHESMRVLRHRWILGERQVVAEERGAVSQRPGPENVGSVGVEHLSIAFRKHDEHRTYRHAGEGVVLQMWRVGGLIAR